MNVCVCAGGCMKVFQYASQTVARWIESLHTTTSSLWTFELFNWELMFDPLPTGFGNWPSRFIKVWMKNHGNDKSLFTTTSLEIPTVKQPQLRINFWTSGLGIDGWCFIFLVYLYPLPAGLGIHWVWAKERRKNNVFTVQTVGDAESEKGETFRAAIFVTQILSG